MNDISKQASVFVLILWVCAVLAHPTRAFADDGVGAFRLGVHIPAFSLIGLDHDPAGGRGGITSHPAYQAGAIPILGVDIGLQVHELVSIGATLIAGAVGSTESNNGTIGGGGIIPRVEVSMPEGMARLYGAGEFGIGVFGLFGFNCFGGSDCNPSYGAYAAGGEVGVHLFVADSFSIDPYLSVRYLRAFNLDTGVWLGQVGIAITGWIGGPGTSITP